jgi:hypothetical protein
LGQISGQSSFNISLDVTGGTFKFQEALAEGLATFGGVEEVKRRLVKEEGLWVRCLMNLNIFTCMHIQGDKLHLILLKKMKRY